MISINEGHSDTNIYRRASFDSLVVIQQFSIVILLPERRNDLMRSSLFAFPSNVSVIFLFLIRLRRRIYSICSNITWMVFSPLVQV